MKVGMFPLVLAVLKRDDTRGGGGARGWSSNPN